MIKPCAKCGKDFEAKTCAKYCPACRDIVRREKRRESDCRYREVHREERRKRDRRYCEKHREERRERTRRYREEHYEECRERARCYRAEHREECREYARCYRENKRRRLKAEQFRAKMALRKQQREQAEAERRKQFSEHWTDNQTLNQFSL